MLERKIILIYEGEFTQEITKSVLSMAERNMDNVGEESGIKRKVFNVMVECLQNISKHADKYEANTDVNNAIFMIGKQGPQYFVISGNPMLTERVPSLCSRLENINSLDKQGLKALYKDIIKNGSLSDKGGAGLGFIDMARKSGEKLQFDFEPMDDKYSFFSLTTVVSKK